MATVYEILGIPPTDDRRQLRSAYHRMVKMYHPDRFTNPDEQARAQKKLIELNLAYEQAMKTAGQRSAVFQTIPAVRAKVFARRLIEQGEAAGALRQLARADEKDDEWYFLEGQVMMLLKQWGAAHQSFREAVRREPDNRPYREEALEAAVRLKRQGNPVLRLADWAQGLLKGQKK